MEVVGLGGLVAKAFGLFLGNPDVMVTLIGWGMFCTIILTVLDLARR